MASLRGSGLSNGCLSAKNGRIRAWTPVNFPRWIAIPTSMPVTVFVAERVSRRVPAFPSKYAS
jgi:hypothetical protein